MVPQDTKNRDSQSQDSGPPDMALYPADSDQTFLRVLEMGISQCMESKLKLSMLLEYITTGLSIIEHIEMENFGQYAPETVELRDRFKSTAKTPNIQQTYNPDVDTQRGMSYLIRVGDVASLSCAQVDQAPNIMIALELAYEKACEPFINIKGEVRSRLKFYGIVTTLDVIGEFNQRLRDLKEGSAKLNEVGSRAK